MTAESPPINTHKDNGSQKEPKDGTELRYAHCRTILGEDLYSRIRTSRILVVGAGGIGCELLKNLVLSGFERIDIIDLDIIDLSNLNRQFLFQKSHIRKPKSIVAAQTAASFNPSVRITPYHANIKDPQFDTEYYSQFKAVLNALDNLEARRWVNKMCIAAETPLIESGTTGFLGQVQPIMKGVTECYDCTPKPTPKSYPVCTIRSTPSTSVHCIVWAKEWLFTQLFGADEEREDQELNQAVADGEDATEVANLQKEAREVRDIRDSLLRVHKDRNSYEISERVFNKVFFQDVQRLLSMEEMWRNRRKPIPLQFSECLTKSDNTENISAAFSQGDGPSNVELKDQKKLSLKETVHLFVSSFQKLASRAAAGSEQPLVFDKDDDNALDFVTAASNLRARIYGIETKTRFQAKEMAGNIIPAIASTNAIIAGALVMQALHVLRKDWDAARFMSLSTSASRVFASFPLANPNPACGVCNDVYVALYTDTAQLTLQQLIDDVAKESHAKGGLGLQVEEMAIYEGNRLLADPDFEDNFEKTLLELGIRKGCMVSIVDEDGIKATVNFCIEELSKTQSEDQPAFKLRTPLPILADKPKVPTSNDDSSSDEGVLISATPHTPPSFAIANNGDGTSGSRKRTADDADINPVDISHTADAIASQSDSDKTNGPKRLRTSFSGSNADSAIVLD